MKLFTVHPPAPGRKPSISYGSPEEDLAFTPDSFSVGAFLFGPLWLIAHRLWLWLAAWLAGAVVFLFVGVLIAGRVSVPVVVLAALLVQILFALEAHNLRRRKLERSGRAAVDVVAARDIDDAAARFFVRNAIAEPSRPTERPSASAPQTSGFLAMFPNERAP